MNTEKIIKPKMKVGDTVWVVGNDRNNEGLTETFVTKVGKKYFEVDRFFSRRFFIDTLKHDGKGYSSAYTVYLDKESYLEKKEISQLSEKIRKEISMYGNIKQPVEILRAVWDLIKPKP